MTDLEREFRHALGKALLWTSEADRLATVYRAETNCSIYIPADIVEAKRFLESASHQLQPAPSDP